MRVIAQFGRLDVPYENFAFHITKDNYVVATRDSIASLAEMELGVMAKYSSFEKAERAMEMLHVAYRELEVEKTYKEGLYSFKNVFRFPQEDEIE